MGAAGTVSTAIAAALTSEGYRVRQVQAGSATRPCDGDVCEVALASPSSVRQLREWISEGEMVRVGGILNFFGLYPSLAGGSRDEAEAAWNATAWTFNLVKEFANDLHASAGEEGGWFINLTRLDGKFGLDEGQILSVAAAGTLGIAKTLRREYPRLRVKAIDADPRLPEDMLAACVLQELAAEDDLVEVGLTRRGRWRLDLIEQPSGEVPPLSLDRDAVVLVTGGACGITAEVARALAAAAQPRLILMGRSPLPEEETAATRGLDTAGLRKLFLDEARAGGGPIVPAEIEHRLNRLLKDRQIRANLAACTAAGAVVEYRSLDVRQSERFAALIDDLYERFGRIDGVIHGAGIIEDRRIADKTLESFVNVFRTKVDSALTLARKLRPEGLKFLAFFGSVSGRFGNAGQVDYSAANEVMNKLADQLQRRWPGRIVCLNWGPWEGGMVTEELRRLYAAAGIGLISTAEGVAAFLTEICRTDRCGSEVVIGRGIDRMLRMG